MFDFISYVRDSGLQVRILPPFEGALITLEVCEPGSSYRERYTITDRDASMCSNIDKYTGEVLDSMAARIGRRKARMYANLHKSSQRQDIEKLFRGE